MNFRRRKPASGPPRLAAALDPSLRTHCALWTDGRCKIAPGHEYDPPLRAAAAGTAPFGGGVRRNWRRRRPRRRRSRRPGAGRTTGPIRRSSPACGRCSLRRRGRGASDAVFELSADACRAYAIVNDRKLPLAEPLDPGVGGRAMGYLFHSKDEGSGQTSYQRQSFQGFSIRGGGAVPLPDAISALRCQRGPHEPDGDHLFARIFYRDSLLAADTTLEKLGFSAAEAEAFAEIRSALHGGVFIGGSTGDGKSTTLATQPRRCRWRNRRRAEHGDAGGPGGVSDSRARCRSRCRRRVRARSGRATTRRRCRILLPGASGVGHGVGRSATPKARARSCSSLDTGHQIWTTIHVDNANAILFRLLDLGVSAAEVCKPGNVALLMKQTLLPELCPSCARREPAEPPPPWLVGAAAGVAGRAVPQPGGLRALPPRRRRGDRREAWNGYAGQTALAESIHPDEGYLDLVRRVEPGAARTYWTAELGGVPIGLKIWERVAQGRTDPARRAAEGRAARPGRRRPPRGRGAGGVIRLASAFARCRVRRGSRSTTRLRGFWRRAASWRGRWRRRRALVRATRGSGRGHGRWSAGGRRSGTGGSRRRSRAGCRRPRRFSSTATGGWTRRRCSPPPRAGGGAARAPDGGGREGAGDAEPSRGRRRRPAVGGRRAPSSRSWRPIAPPGALARARAAFRAAALWLYGKPGDLSRGAAPSRRRADGGDAGLDRSRPHGARPAAAVQPVPHAGGFGVPVRGAGIPARGRRRERPRVRGAAPQCLALRPPPDQGHPARDAGRQGGWGRRWWTPATGFPTRRWCTWWRRSTASRAGRRSCRASSTAGRRGRNGRCRRGAAGGLNAAMTTAAALVAGVAMDSMFRVLDAAGAALR